ncbi:hypothetical protein BN946_scf185010.g53 [Trametes cinnabarina]|uniref:Uncharacterized protein n=1 Tax=Pycnoporus cinnabarinus TaxID=5643 RepID=A0A060SRN2_PYCCI|nr:hypothetical protein BN946_scf185010.g53 [Trametes cinnabarina]
MSSPYKYERLPTSPNQSSSDLKRRTSRDEPTSDIHELHRRLEEDPRFNPPTPSAWKRVALILFMIACLWIGFKLRTAVVETQQPKVIHASRYSKEYKFRPAASPIITERLKDGRVRVRGAAPSMKL